MKLEKNKTIIIDNFLDENLILDVTNSLGENNISETWYDLQKNHIYDTFCKVLLNECKKYYDLSKIIGYEFWTQNNTRPCDWHVDKDEETYKTTREFVLPVCSIVYYSRVNNLSGGNLYFKDCVIIPKRNRLVIFPSGVWHKVDEFSGQRTSILINPWNIKPLGYS